MQQLGRGIAGVVSRQLAGAMQPSGGLSRYLLSIYKFELGKLFEQNLNFLYSK